MTKRKARVKIDPETRARVLLVHAVSLATSAGLQLALASWKQRRAAVVEERSIASLHRKPRRAS